MKFPMDRFLRPLSLCLFACGVLAFAPLRAQAQDEPRTVIEVQLAGQGKTLNQVRPLDLRPNTSAEFGIELKNTHTEKLNEVTVKVVQIDARKKIRPLAEAKLLALNPGEKALLAFEEIKGVKKGPLVGEPPYKVQLHINAAKAIGFEPIKVDLNMSIAEPSKYINEDAEIKTKAGNRRFKVEVTDDIKAPGPHRCPVRIVLGPEFVPTKKGSYSRTFNEPKQKDELFADGLTLAGKYKTGRIFLNVDGYDRAFIYDISAVGEGKVTPRSFTTKRGVLVPIERYRKPDAKFVVPLELDGPLSDNYRVELGLDRTGEKERFFEVRKLTGLRMKKIGLAVSKTKNLVLQTEVNDWQPQFDTAGIYGDLWLRLQVYYVNPDTGMARQEDLAIAAELPPDLAKMELDGKTLYVRVTQDDSAVENIAFADVSKDQEWPVGQKMPLTITIKKRGPGQAPIEKVILVRGKAPKEKDEIKPEDLFGKDLAPPEGRAEWSFTIPAQAKAEPLVVTAVFTTKTGVTTAKTETIYYSAKGTTPAKTLATIKGVVKHGELPQPGKEVVLTDVKDAKKKEMAKTNDKGEFVFTKVPPGAYVVSVSFSDVATFAGEKKVEVKEGDKTIDLGDLPVLQKN